MGEDLLATPRSAAALPSLASVDLNLLVIFDALMQTRSVSRAADQVGLTQPAVSNALRRLRHLLEDELLVRSGNGMEPTARAIALHPAVSEAMHGIRGALWGPEVFDASTARRIFRVAMTDAVALTVLPPVLRRLQETAPGVCLAVTNCGMEDGEERILTGELELGVGVYLSTRPGLRIKSLAEGGRLSCLAWAGNSRLKDGKLDLESYLAAPHVIVGVNRDPGVTIDIAAAALGLSRHIAAVVPHFTSVPAIVRGSDIIGPSNPHLIDRLAYRDELVLFEPPLPAQAYALSVVWRRSAMRDNALAWLRGFIEGVVREEVAWDRN